MYNNCVIYIIVCSFREVGGVYEYLLPALSARVNLKKEKVSIYTF